MAARICELAAQGQTVPQISKALGLDYHNTRSVLKYRGADIKLAYRRWTDATWKEVHALVLEGWTCREIAEKIGVNCGTLQSLMRQVRPSPLPAWEWLERIVRRRLYQKVTSVPYEPRAAQLIREGKKVGHFSHDVYQRIGAVIPPTIRGDLREELLQELAVMLIEKGELQPSDWKIAFKGIQKHYREVSFETPIPGGRDGRRTLHDVISDTRSFDPSD